MRVIHGLDSLLEPLRQTTVAIGVFDGVHRGHQEILHQTVREARSQGFAPVALTFDIHPSELFAPVHSPPYIASLAQRMELMAAWGGGLEAVVVARFDHAFAGLSPQAFVADVLTARLGARRVLVGEDFCYGRGRAGTVATLRQSGEQSGFAVTVVPPFLLHDERVSSTRIRALVAEGRLPEARELLGHPFVVQGQVRQGKRLGRTLGYPTANLDPAQPRQLLPGSGVYAGYAALADGRRIRAAISVGVNLTTDSDGLRKVEAYLMDGFSEDIYDQPLSLDFRAHIREERRFESLGALVSQMERDVAEVAALVPQSVLEHPSRPKMPLGKNA